MRSARRRLSALLPVLVAEAAAAREPLPALRRLLRVLEAIGARSAYLALLLHNARARVRLVRAGRARRFSDRSDRRASAAAR